MTHVKALVALTIACVGLSLAAPGSDAHAGVRDRRQHLIKRAKSQLGTRYRYGGGVPPTWLRLLGIHALDFQEGDRPAP